MKIAKRAALGLTLAAIAIAGVAPAQAQWRHDGYRGYRGHRGGDAGVAVGAGILGLAVGAAIASNGNHGYRDRGYYDGYYGRPYRPYYNGYYNGPRDDYRYRERCWTTRAFDEYSGRWVLVERCR